MEPFDTKLLELSRIFTDDQASFSYLLRLLQKRQILFCPSCHNDDFYLLSRNRLKCKRCRYEFRPLAKTKFSLLNIPFSRWLHIIKKFELDVSPQKASAEVQLSYKTTLKAYNILRNTIIDMLAYMDPNIEEEVISAGRDYTSISDTAKSGRGHEQPVVFGIVENENNVTVDIVKKISAKEIMKHPIKKARRGSIVYTDKWNGYDTLLFCGYQQVKKYSHGFKNETVLIDKKGGFWNFAVKQLIKPHVLSKERFIFYIKEMEWRYNHQKQNMFDLLINYMLLKKEDAA